MIDITELLGKYRLMDVKLGQDLYEKYQLVITSYGLIEDYEKRAFSDLSELQKAIFFELGAWVMQQKEAS